MITVDGKIRRFEDVDKKDVEERLLNALGNILAEEGVDVEQVEITEVDYRTGYGGKYTIEVTRK